MPFVQLKSRKRIITICLYLTRLIRRDPNPIGDKLLFQSLRTCSSTCNWRSRLGLKRKIIELNIEKSHWKVVNWTLRRTGIVALELLLFQTMDRELQGQYHRSGCKNVPESNLGRSDPKPTIAKTHCGTSWSSNTYIKSHSHTLQTFLPYELL